LFAEDFQITTIVDEEGKVDLNVKRIKTKAMAKERVEAFGLAVQDTVAQMKESLILHKDSHAESMSNLTTLSTQRTLCQGLLSLYLPFLTRSNF